MCTYRNCIIHSTDDDGIDEGEPHSKYLNRNNLNHEITLNDLLY